MPRHSLVGQTAPPLPWLSRRYVGRDEQVVVREGVDVDPAPPDIRVISGISSVGGGCATCCVRAAAFAVAVAEAVIQSNSSWVLPCTDRYPVRYPRFRPSASVST